MCGLQSGFMVRKERLPATAVLRCWEAIETLKE
jgi:hypothetical protein